MTAHNAFAIVSFIVAASCHAAAGTVTIPSTDFDFVQRVNYGTSSVFEANAESFSVYAVGDNNSAQQTWFRVGEAVAKASGGQGIRSAKLVFRAGTEDHAARTVFLSRTDLAVTSSANRKTFDGSSPYPSVPGTTASFSRDGYLVKPLSIAIDSNGAGQVDVTDWLKSHPRDCWFLTTSPAASGNDVTSAEGANWGSRWHWENPGTRTAARRCSWCSSWNCPPMPRR